MLKLKAWYNKFPAAVRSSKGDGRTKRNVGEEWTSVVILLIMVKPWPGLMMNK